MKQEKKEASGMKKRLKDLSQKELWKLFPIFLVKHDDSWDAQYAVMKRKLQEALAGFSIARISHVGSTAIPGIWAKNIVDIMVELAPEEDMEQAAKTIEALGFARKYTEPGRIFLHLGYTEEGFAKAVFHLHLRYRGDCDELYFRDYLCAHPALALEYEALKKQLWKQYEHNRDAYTEGKTAFIRKWTEAAKVEYAGRYH